MAIRPEGREGLQGRVVKYRDTRIGQLIYGDARSIQVPQFVVNPNDPDAYRTIREALADAARVATPEDPAKVLVAPLDGRTYDEGLLEMPENVVLQGAVGVYAGANQNLIVNLGVTGFLVTHDGFCGFKDMQVDLDNGDAFPALDIQSSFATVIIDACAFQFSGPNTPCVRLGGDIAVLSGRDFLVQNSSVTVPALQVNSSLIGIVTVFDCQFFNVVGISIALDGGAPSNSPSRFTNCIVQNTVVGATLGARAIFRNCQHVGENNSTALIEVNNGSFVGVYGGEFDTDAGQDVAGGDGDLFLGPASVNSLAATDTFESSLTIQGQGFAGGIANQDEIRTRRETDNILTYTLVQDDRYFSLARAGAPAPATVELPAAPRAGQRHTIMDGGGDAAGDNITVDGNGNNIEGAATATISTAFGTLEVFFDGGVWLITAST